LLSPYKGRGKGKSQKKEREKGPLMLRLKPICVKRTPPKKAVRPTSEPTRGKKLKSVRGDPGKNGKAKAGSLRRCRSAIPS